MDFSFWLLLLTVLCVAAASIFFVVRRRQSRPNGGSEVSQPTVDRLIDKDVQFTVYRPATVVPEKWYPLVAFAHLSKRRVDAPEDEPDPIQQVSEQAARILSDQPATYEPAKLDRAFAVPRKGLLTFVPVIEGCELNPPSQSVLWQKSVHKVEFEMMASNAVDGRAVEGQVTVYLGNVILTEVPLRINVDKAYSPAKREQRVMDRADPYRKIFASYSHKDTVIVEDFENFIEAIGDQYLRDIRTLRSGEVWSEQLEEMIRSANIFQLFWSSNSMHSPFVKQEWEYALSLERPNFIRPVYWEDRFPEEMPDLPPETLRRLHFHRLRGEPEQTSSRIAPPRPASEVFRGPTGDVRAIDPPENVDPSKPPPIPHIHTPVSPEPEHAAPQKAPFRILNLKILTTIVFGGLLSLGTLVYMSSSSKTPMISVELNPSTELSIDRYELIVKNLSPGVITDVEILAELSPEVKYFSSNPPAERVTGQMLMWRQATIEKDQSIAIRISVGLGNFKRGDEIITRQMITFNEANGRRRTCHSGFPISGPLTCR